MKKIICAAMAALVAFGMCACASSTTKEEGNSAAVEESASSNDGYTEYEWVTGGLADKVPQFKSEKCQIIQDTDDVLYIWLKPVTAEEYNSYIDSCKKAGYKKKATYAENESFSATGSNGYKLSVMYDENQQSMGINLTKAAKAKK